jgi:nuclear pore complex protein Nup133
METRYFVKKKTLLALSKLTALASDMPEAVMKKHVDGKGLLEIMLLNSASTVFVFSPKTTDTV